LFKTIFQEGYFSTLKITDAHKKVKVLGITWDKMKYRGCLQCGVPRTVHLSALSQQTGFLLRKPVAAIQVIHPLTKYKVPGSVFNYDTALTLVYGYTHCGLFCDCPWQCRHASPHNTTCKTNERVLPYNHTWRLKF
jgi:hypothetical protein